MRLARLRHRSLPRSLLTVSALLAIVCGGNACSRARASPTTSFVVVDVAAPGHSAVQVEATVLTPIERALSGLVDVKGVRGEAAPGHASVRLRFDDLGTATAAQTEVQSRLGALALPREPIITRVPPTTRLLFTLRGQHRALWELRAMADDLVRARLLPVAGVFSVTLCGAALQQATLTLDPARLAALGLTIADVKAAIAGPAGGAAPRLQGPRVRLEELEALPLGTREPRPRLRDIGVLSLESVPDPCPGAGDPAAVIGDVHVRVRAEAKVREELDAIARQLPPNVSLQLIAERAPEHVITLFGPELDELEQLAERLARAARQGPGVEAVRTRGAERQPELSVIVDRERAAARGVSLAQLAAAMDDVVMSTPAGDVRVRQARDPSARAATMVAPGVALSDVATLEHTEQPALIIHIDQRRAVELLVQPAPGADVSQQLRTELTKVSLPPGYHLEHPSPK